MSNTFINILDFLACKTLFNRIFWVEFLTFYKTSKLRLFVNFFNLAEWKFDCIEFRWVRYYPYPLDCELTHQFNHILCLVSCQIVHDNSDLLALIELTEFSDEATEYFWIYRAVVLLKIFKAASFTDSRNDCCIASAHSLNWKPYVFITLTPLLCEVCSLCKHSFIKPDDFSLRFHCNAEPLFHDVSKAIISIFIDSLRHFGDFNRFLLD